MEPFQLSELSAEEKGSVGSTGNGECEGRRWVIEGWMWKTTLSASCGFPLAGRGMEGEGETRLRYEQGRPC